MTHTMPLEWTRDEVARLCGRNYEDFTWGVPDTNPSFPLEMFCNADHPEGPVCTRVIGHRGRHAAANGEGVVIAVWLQACVFCGAKVTDDSHGSWVDSTDGDGCDSPLGVHEPATGGGSIHFPNL